MDLRTFLFTARTTAAHMARQLEIHPAYLRLIVAGKKKPSKKLCRQIVSYTKGIVAETDLLGPRQEDHLQKFIDENAKKEAIA